MVSLTTKLKTLPEKPGVYLFKNATGEVLYVGKAKNLKNRVKSYFPPHPVTPRRDHLLPQGEKDKMKSLLGRGIKEEIMLREIVDLDYIIVSSELESLMLENNLIKQYRPRFNVRMRDDKNYQFIKIDYATAIPQIYPVRRIDSSTTVRPLSQPLPRPGERGKVLPSPGEGRVVRQRPDRERSKDKYFGPYTSGFAVKQTLKLIRRVFGLCANKKVGSRPCFYYHIGRCTGVCIGQMSLPRYRRSLKAVEQFLGHRQGEVLRELKQQMAETAKNREFEKAATLRDKIASLRAIWERQKVVFTRKLSEDYFSLFQGGSAAVVNLFQVREGRIIHQETFEVLNTARLEEPQILQSFLNQYYAEASDKPKTIVVRCDLPEKKILARWLAAKLLTPRRGKKLGLLKLGEENAKDYYERSFASSQKVLGQLQLLLKLPRLPNRIEAFDISNIQGFLPVGSMVVFEEGLPKKSEYRKFKINNSNRPPGAGGPDDVAMMREMLTRRFKHLSPVILNRQQAVKDLKDSSVALLPQNDKNKIWPLPDLIVIDGGKGQLNAALKVLKMYNLSPFGGSPEGRQFPAIGLAKRLEEIYLPGRKHPLRLPPNSPVLYLLERVRDEAHRFAITFYRQRHRQYETRSRLDEVPGVGPVIRKKLIKQFGSVAGIKSASLEALAQVVGLSVARKIKEQI